jgi:hypothetical protein
MPYGGEKNAEQTGKIERCVERLVANGHTKESAIRICKDSVLNKGKK